MTTGTWELYPNGEPPAQPSCAHDGERVEFYNLAQFLCLECGFWCDREQQR